MKAELMPISLIFLNNFPKELKFQSNELFMVSHVKDDESAFENLKDNIERNRLYNVILSGYKTVEEAYKLLKSFIDYNIKNAFNFDNSNYPFFFFIENENFNKNKLYSYYIEQEKNREEPLDEEYKIDSKIILFSNLACNFKDKLNKVINYYHRKDVEVKINPYFSPFIKIMYIGVTGTGKSTMINELNGEKISYSSSENHVKTKGNLLFKNRKYPILNQDTEGFEIADNSQIDKVNDNINKNIGDNFNERLHIVIYLLKNNRGLDKTDLPLIIKLHKMKILYYIVWPKEDGKDKKIKGKANRLLINTKELIKNKDNGTEKLFKDFKNKKELIQIIETINNRLEDKIFSANILAEKSEGRIRLLDQINKDLLKVYNIHENFINTIENFELKQEKFTISISGDILKQNENNYIKMLDESPFFFKYSIDDIKRKEAEKLLDDCDVSIAWLLFYNTRVENFRISILNKIKKIYSDVKIDAEIDKSIFSDKESWFYKTENTKQFIKHLIDFFASRYKDLELSRKYYSSCKEYNNSIIEFGKYVEEFKNAKINEEAVRYDIDFIQIN